MPNRAHTDVKDNHAESRYEVRVDGELAGFAKYRVEGDRQVFLDTQVDPLPGQRHSVNGSPKRHCKTYALRVGWLRPRCEFIADYIREHPLDLLAGSSEQHPRPVA